jgi:hypothetical protein
MLGQADVIRRFALLALSFGLGGCTTNHDALALKPSGGSGGGGAGGSAGGGGTGNVGGPPAMGGRANPDIEPAGDNVLTIVNGVVDAESVRLCFARVTDEGETSELEGDPLPELAYAATTVLPELPGLSFTDDAIEPWVIAGDLSLVEGLDCEAAVELAESEEAKVTPNPEVEPAEPLEEPALRARSLAVLPAGTVDIGRSILLVLSGCIGGAAYTDDLDTAVCGNDYSAASPTLQPIVVKLSRQHRSDTVGLQALHASVATASLDVRSSGDSGRVSLVFASSVSFGAIEPRPAETRYSVSELGVDDGYALQAVDERGEVALEQSWNDVLSASSVPRVTFGRTYTAIFLGPNPVIHKRGWWNPPAFSLVDNDPTRAQ